MKKLKIGFIGTGFVAGFHASAFRAVRNSEITAVYNYREPSAKDLASRIENLGVGKPKIYTDIWEMVSDKSVDAFWILNPNFARVSTVESITEEAIQGRGDITGICCEKPLARTADEAEKMVELVEKAGLFHGYLENQVYSPAVVKGKDAIWKYGSPYSGRPYLVRAAEEHGGPHKRWFWDPKQSGGGVLLDMTCHSLETDRYLVSNPLETKESLKPLNVQSMIASLKWTNEPYLTKLREEYEVDYSKSPAEDYALTIVIYEDENGNQVYSEARTSWSYIGPGLRLTFEVLGPEYSITINSLQQELNAFFSRNINIPPSEDFLEKQAAEQGLIPMIPNEEITYGYVDENRHMVESFIEGKMPEENWNDGLLVCQLMMMAYLSAETGRKIKFDTNKVKGYKPKVALGEWNPKTQTQ